MSITELLKQLRSGKLKIADYLDQLEARFVDMEPLHVLAMAHHYNMDTYSYIIS